MNPLQFNNALDDYDLDASAVKFFGIDNAIRSAAALKSGNYAKSVTELAKAALKWTCIGGALIGGYKLYQGPPPIYLNDVEAEALKELSQQEDKGTLSFSTKLFIDQSYAEQNSFKYWSEEGKKFLYQNLASNNTAAGFNTRYLIKKGKEQKDSKLIYEVIKTCARSNVTTASCLQAKTALAEHATFAKDKKTMLSACRKSHNVFCQESKAAALKNSLQSGNIVEMIKACSETNSTDCDPALQPFEKPLLDQTEKALKKAQEIVSTCKNNNLAICKKASKVVSQSVIQFSSWSTITKTADSLCKSKEKSEECRDFLEDATNALVKELSKPGAEVIDNSWNTYYALRPPSWGTFRISKIAIAFNLLDRAIKAPSSEKTQQNLNDIIDFLNRCKDRADPYTFTYVTSLQTFLDEKIKVVEKQIKMMPKPLTSERTSQPVIRLKEGFHDFGCELMTSLDRIAVYSVGRHIALSTGAFGNYPIPNETEIDWESCGL